MSTEFPDKIRSCQVLSPFRLVRAPISVLQNVLAAGSFLFPFQVVGSCGYVTMAVLYLLYSTVALCLYQYSAYSSTVPIAVQCLPPCRLDL